MGLERGLDQAVLWSKSQRLSFHLVLFSAPYSLDNKTLESSLIYKALSISKVKAITINSGTPRDERWHSYHTFPSVISAF